MRPVVRTVVLGILAVGAGLVPATASAQTTTPLPWVVPASPPLPPDYTVPYRPGVRPICPQGKMACFYDLKRELERRVAALGCSHHAIAADAYLTITNQLIGFTQAGLFHRPERLTHEARQYAQEYLDQFDRWRAGSANVSLAWAVALQASEEQSVTGIGDLLLWLNAHIRRDNPIRAVEQSEGVLRVQGAMPGASGRPDHDAVSEALQDSLEPMLAHNAEAYDSTVDDGAVLFGTVMDAEGLYLPISSWREESWRNGEQLRHLRAAFGEDSDAYRLKLQQIEANALESALLIKAATLATPQQVAERNSYCAANQG